MSALPPKADMCGATRDVRFGPIADIAGHYAGCIQPLCGGLPLDLSSQTDIVVQDSTEIRVRRSIFALLVLTTTAHAQLVIFTYDQWERLSPGLQEIYLAGAIDSLSTITTPPSAATSKYYNDCLAKKQITAHIIAEDMRTIVQTRPELRPKPATGVLLQSLIKLCGSPVPDWPSPSQ